MSDIFIDYAAGIVGGIVVTVIGHPFDTTKTRLQASPPDFYAGTIDCVRKTVKWEGARGFYAGIWSPLVGQMFFRAASFATYHNTVKIISKNKDRPTTEELLIAGSVTGFMISFIEAPMDLIKTKLQIQTFARQLNKKYKPRYTSVAGYIQYSISRHGPLALWQGWSATVIRNVPANMFYFPIYELWKLTFAQYNDIPVSELKLHHRLFSGAAAGLGYWMGTYPLDAIKSRMQSVRFEERQGWWSTVRMMIKEGGWRSFTRGIVPCAIRSAPACAAMFSTVDFVRDTLRYYHRHSSFTGTSIPRIVQVAHAEKKQYN